MGVLIDGQSECGYTINLPKQRGREKGEGAPQLTLQEEEVGEGRRGTTCTQKDQQ